MGRQTICVSLRQVASAVTVVFVAAYVIAITASSQGRADRQYINLKPRGAQAVYSDAVLAGSVLYVAARIGTDPSTGKVPDDVEREAKFVLDQIKAVVEKAGLTMDEIVNVQVFCPEPTVHSPKFNAVYRTYFGENVPARAFTGSGPLLGGARFQVQAVAIKR
jgi:enamine deaminase RidA (YjgF/YER057c/UK114 family)